MGTAGRLAAKDEVMLKLRRRGYRTIDEGEVDKAYAREIRSWCFEVVRTMSSRLGTTRIGTSALRAARRCGDVTAAG